MIVKGLKNKYFNLYMFSYKTKENGQLNCASVIMLTTR